MADEYPLPVFHFSVQWAGQNSGFSEVGGLTSETQVIEYRHGLSPDFSGIKMPGLQKYPNITLKRGILPKDNDFFNWYSSTKMNKPQRRDITISLLNENHEPVVVWNIHNAFPIKVEGPALKSTGNDVAVESIELAHEGLTVQRA